MMLAGTRRLLALPLAVISLSAVADSASIKPRIVGGEPVVVADHPWMASLQGLP